MNTKQDLKSGKALDQQLVISQIEEICRSEHHFNMLEAEYRKLASTWLLAAFAGMGYIATTKDLPIAPGPTIFALAAGASIGIQLLWVVDLLTYHQLLLANFFEGWRLEKAHSFLPPIRINMLAQGNTGKRVRFFYLGSSLVPLAFGVAAYFAINHAQTNITTDRVILFTTAALIISCAVLMKKSAKNWLNVKESQ